MIWANPPPYKPDPPKKGKPVTPEQLAGDSESSHQRALFAWAALSVGKYPSLAYMFAIPNGGLRDMRTATTLKAEGVKSGVCDIFLPQWSIIKTSPSHTRMLHGCFIEMKLEKYRNRKNGGCSEEQIDFIEWAASA